MNTSKKTLKLRNINELRNIIENSPTAGKLLSEVKEILKDLGSEDANLAVVTTFVVIALEQNRKNKG